MAVRCSLETSSSNGNICLSTWDLQGIYRHKSSQDIVYDGKRIRWQNDYESLQKLIECVFAQQGKWKSAGGTSKKFVSSIVDLSCTWYPGKLNSLLFHGETGDLVNEILVTACKSTSFNTFVNSVKGGIQNIPERNSRDVDGMAGSSHTQTLNVSCSAVEDMYKQPSPKYVDQSTQTVDPNREQCLCVDLVSEFDNMKINFEIILTRIDALQSLANIQAICFCNDNIVHLESELDGEGRNSTKTAPTISPMEKENSEIEALKNKINSLDIKLEKCLKDYDAILNQPSIVIPQVPIVPPQSPIVPPQSPIVPPQAPITPSSHVNKQNLDQCPEVQIPCHVKLIPQVPIVPLQSPIAPPKAPITPSLHVNKQHLDQSPEVQLPCHVSKVFLNKLPLCDTQGFNCKQVNTLNELSLLPQHVMTPCQSLESNSPLLSNRLRNLSGKIPNGHGHANRSSKPLHGLRQPKTSSLRVLTQPQRKIAPFRKHSANFRPPRIVLEKQSMEWAVYLQFVSQMTSKSSPV